MIFPGSRYADTEIIEDGEVRLLALRRLPAERARLDHVVLEGERLDQLAARFYGDPRRSWLILDANPEVLDPFALLRPGARIRVPGDRL